MRKKFLVMVLLVCVLCAVSAFAGEANMPGIGTMAGQPVATENPADSKGFGLKIVPRLVAFLTGLLPGAIVMVKFVLDIVKAYANREQNPAGLQKAVVNFLIVVAVLVCFTVAIAALFEGQAGNTTGKQGAKFLSGITGAEVSEDWLAEHGFEAFAGDAVAWL